MPSAICFGGKAAVPYYDRGAFKISSKADINLRRGNGEISFDSPREHHVATAADQVTSANRKGGNSFATVFDYIVFIDSCGGRGTVLVVAGKRQPCFEILWNRERMQQATGIRVNIEFEVNRLGVRYGSLVRSSKLRANSRGALMAGEAGAWLHHTNMACNRNSSRETCDWFVTKF
jgi:hypothetical protein